MGVTKMNERLPVEICIGGRLLSQAVSFRYLQTLFSEGIKCDKVIKAKLEWLNLILGI